jgi:hypothetical protein
MPRLSDVELRVLLVVADQTLGWIEDPETKRRKDRDWISQYQLMTKINRSDRGVQKALKRLVDELAIVQAFDEEGQLLDSSQKRMRCGGKIFYRLSLRPPQPELFSHTPENRSRVKRDRKNFAQPPKILRAKNLRATKETLYTKLAKASELDSNKNKNGGKPVDKPRDPNKPKLPTNALMRSFNQYCKAIRKTKPVFVRFKDGGLIKHALKHVTEFQLEMLFIWFLREKTAMQPAIGAALCKEVIADFIDTSHKQYGFYGGLEQLARRYTPRPEAEIKTEASSMAEALKKLKESFGLPFSQQEQARMREEAIL